MEDHHQRIIDLIIKLEAGNATVLEMGELDQWFQCFENDEKYTTTLSEDQRIALKNSLFTSISKQLETEFQIEVRPVKKKLWWPGLAAAASIVFVLGAGIFFYTVNNGFLHPGDYAKRDRLNGDIKPGGNKAILTLADGSTIALTNAKNGALAKQYGVQINKTADGQLVYEGRNISKGYSDAMNTVETPRGGQYQVRLPDGTKVWLNAASKLIYPVSFNGREDRRVELSGEAYFEVAKDKAHPFKVKSSTQEVKVLGTHFNVNAYQDEPAIKTTLLEGSIKIDIPLTNLSPGHVPVTLPAGQRLATSPPYFKEEWSKTGVVLKPNQQSTLSKNQIQLTEVDPSEAVAWKNGYFKFKALPLESVMRQISRWYDLEIVYENQASTETFNGIIDRKANLSRILKILEKGGVHFRIEGKKLIVIQ